MTNNHKDAKCDALNKDINTQLLVKFTGFKMFSLNLAKIMDSELTTLMKHLVWLCAS